MPHFTSHDEQNVSIGCMDAGVTIKHNEDGPCEFLDVDQTALNFDPKANKPDNDKCIGGSTADKNGGFSTTTNTTTNEGETFSNFEGFSITEGNKYA